jgi:hypothetical protein
MAVKRVMDDLGISYGEARALLKIISDKNQWHSLLGHLMSPKEIGKADKRIIDLAPFLENPTKYLKELSPNSLLAKCLNDVVRLRAEYLLTPDAEETVHGFIEAMKFTPIKGANNAFTAPFGFYSKAIYHLLDVRRPVRGMRDALKLYATARHQLLKIVLLRQLEKKLQVARKFTKKSNNEREDYIRQLIDENPDKSYKALWCDADKEIIGETALRRFENLCSEIKNASKKKNS